MKDSVTYYPTWATSESTITLAGRLLSSHFAVIGRKGGQSGTGASKVRGDASYYAGLVKKRVAKRASAGA